MTTNVITVRPETPARAIAALMYRHGISAVPVVDETGSPIGIVSEGDLLPRREAEREQRRDWWLRLLAEGEELNPEFVAEIERSERTARQLMSAPVITVPDAARLSEVADVLWSNRIKRAPVLRDGRMVGIVSRADIVRSIAYPAEAAEPRAGRAQSVSVVEGHAAAPPRQPAAPPATAATKPDQHSAAAFQDLLHRVIHEKVSQPEDDRHLAWEKRRHEVGELLATNLSDDTWSRMLRQARLAASRGEKEYMLLRFPSELCNDRGRAVNAPDPGWPDTLRGFAAQVFTRWQAELRPMGFRLNARVINFPDGLPGDVGLFLVWGE